MAYYKIALIGHLEYHQDDPLWQCFEELSCAGHAVELIDPARYPGVIDGQGKPNERMLACFKRRFRPHAICTAPVSPKEALAAAQDAAPDGGSPVPYRRFVVFGYVGPGNFGDELIFSTICDELSRRHPESYVTLIGHKPQASLEMQGVVSITCEDKLAADIILDGAAALVFMAGIIFDAPFASWTAGPVDIFLNPHSEISGQAAFTLMAKLHGVPAVYLGIGAGPLENPDAQHLVAFSGELGAQFICRDADTQALLAAAGVPLEQLCTKCDLAFLAKAKMATGGAPDALQPYLAVSLREHTSVDEGFFARIAAVLDEAWERHGLRTLFVDAAPEDRAIHAQVAELMQQRAAASFLELNEGSSPIDQTVAALIDAKAVLAMRLHCSIVANSHGVPSIGFNYNPKVASFYEQQGQSDFLAGMHEPTERISQRLDALLGAHEALSGTLEAQTKASRATAAEAFDLLDAHALKTPERRPGRIFYPRSVSVEEEQLHAAQAELAHAREELANARDALEDAQKKAEELEGSTTWKAGRAITAIPRAIKDRR